MKNKKIIGVVIGVMILSISAGIVSKAGIFGKKASTTQTTQQTEVITKQDLTKSISVTGTITSADSYSVTSSITDAKVKELNVKIGDRVKKGDTIATLDTSSIEKSLKLAQENLNLAQEKNNLELQAAQRTYDATRENAEIETTRNTETTQKAQSEYDKAISDASTTKTENDILTKNRKDKDKAVSKAKKEASDAENTLTDKTKKLAEAQNSVDKLKNSLSVSGNGLDTEEYQAAVEKLANAQSEYDNAKANAEAKESTLSSVQNEQTEAKSKEDTSDSKLETANTNIETTKDTLTKAQQEQEDTTRTNGKTLADNQDSITSSQVSASESIITAQQDIDKYQEQLEDAVVKAPADGIVTAVDVKEGDTYKGDQIVCIQNDAGYKVTATVDQYDISDIEKGMDATIKTDTTGDDEMTGKLTFVSPVPKTDTSTTSASGTTSSTAQEYPVEVTIENPSDRLRIGMTAKLTIVEKEAKNALTVPANCVQTDDKGNHYIEVLNNHINTDETQAETEESIGQEGTTEKITVQYGMETDYYVQIISDALREGMQVLVPSDAESDISAETTSQE